MNHSLQAHCFENAVVQFKPIVASVGLLVLLAACNQSGQTTLDPRTLKAMNPFSIRTNALRPASTSTPVFSNSVPAKTNGNMDVQTALASAPIIKKLEVAQTHVIPAEGKSWAGSKLAVYNLHLVGNREALVLVDLVSNPSPVISVLEVLVNGVKLGEVALNPAKGLPKTEGYGPAYSTTASWATLQWAWVKPGLEVRVRTADGQYSATQAIRVGAPSQFTMLTLPFYLFGQNDTAVPAQPATATQASTDEYFAKHPFAVLKITNHPAQKIVWPYIIAAPRNGHPAQKMDRLAANDNIHDVMFDVGDTLRAIRNANGDDSINNQYYAPLLTATPAGKYISAGGGRGGGNVGTGDDAYAGVFLHEAGHAFGMPHANDAFVEGTYPYVGGSLKGSSWGFDQVRNRFMPTFVPSIAQSFKNCANGDFPMRRQFDEQQRCIKQDPMQSGDTDQVPTDKYTMFSDFSASFIQQYMEGTTTLTDGKRTYNGGRIYATTGSHTGYARWDSLISNFVPVETKTMQGGLFGLDNNLAIQRDVPVRTVIITANLAGITETTGDGKLGYADTIKYNPVTTQIYEPIRYVGNLRRLIDPSDATNRASRPIA